MNKVRFIVDQFESGSPAQQLLDRFLIGHNHDGRFHPSSFQVSISLPNAAQNPAVSARIKDFNLQVARPNDDARAFIFCLKAPDPKHAETYEEVLTSLPPGAACFIHGILAHNAERAQKLIALAKTRQLNLAARTAASHLIPLPAKPNFSPPQASRALITVQGAFPNAEIEALDALLPYLPPHCREKVQAVEPISREGFWRKVYSPDWQPLLASAVSRSDTMKGDPEKDGRTQDIVGLHLIEKLAPNPRGWIVSHSTGFRTAIVVVDGAIADTNLAIQTSTGIHSVQLYRPPSPLQDHFSDLAAWIKAFFRTPSAGGDLQETIFAASALEKMAWP